MDALIKFLEQLPGRAHGDLAQGGHVSRGSIRQNELQPHQIGVDAAQPGGGVQRRRFVGEAGIDVKMCIRDRACAGGAGGGWMGFWGRRRRAARRMANTASTMTASTSSTGSR